MIETLSLCPTCYKKIPAYIATENGMVMMRKTCDEHGPFSAVMEKDPMHFSNFYEYGTMNRNNTIIIHAHNECNMKCSWCYYPCGVEKMQPARYYHSLFFYPYAGFNLLLSGGEPTIRPDYFEFVKELYDLGWHPSSITNMIKLGDPEFFKRTINEQFITGDVYRFAMSFQHPTNYSAEILDAKLRALEHIEMAKLKASCVMFSIQSLDELDFIREFYDKTNHLYTMIRIRTMFRNWANKGGDGIFLSDLHKAFLEKFGDLNPTQSREVEHSNIYCLYMRMEPGVNVSLSSAPTVENVDYHMCSRPVYMLAMDGRCYPVPLAQIINEGIASGWKDGFQLKGGAACM